MKIIIFLFLFFILASCESMKKFNSNDTNKKSKKIIMKITTEPSIIIKK